MAEIHPANACDSLPLSGMTHPWRAPSKGDVVGDGRWKLLLLLSLLPLLLLLWQAREEDRRIAADADRAWLTATDPVARHLGQASKPIFWMELASRRCRLWSERDLRRGQSFLRAADRGVREASLPGLPVLQAWFVEFPGGNLDQPGKSLSGPFLATTSRRLVAGLLQEAARSNAGRSGKPSRSVVEGLFGVGTSPELFTSTARGVAFNVLYGNQPALAVWDVIQIGSVCRGAYLILIPIELGDRKIALRATLANWHRLVRKGGLIPAFLPMPGKPGRVKGRVLTIPGTQGRHLAQCLETWRQRPRIEGGAGLDTAQLRTLLRENARLDARIIGERVMGRMHLGGFREGTVERLPETGLRARLAFLDPLAGHIGLLFGPEGKARSTWQKRSVIAWATGVALLWGAGLLLPFLGIRFGGSGVRRELSAWFLGLAAIPLTLTIVASLKYQNDLQINLTEGLRDELLQEFSGLEVGSERLSDKYQQVFRDVSSKPDLVERLLRVETGTASEATLMNFLMRECHRRGADPIGILVTSRNGLTLATFLDSVPTAQQDMFTLVCEVFGRSQFDQEFGKQPSPGPGKGRKNRSVMLGKALTRMAELHDSGAKWNQADDRSQLTTGGKSTLNYRRLLFDGLKQVGVIIFLWDEERVRRRFLAREVPKLARSRGLTVTAFRRKENRLLVLAGAGDGNLRESLRLVARQAREVPALVSRGQALMVAAPNRRMPQFVLAAAISREKVMRRLELEQRRIFGMIGGLLLLILTAAWGVATWLVHPLLVMDQGLRRVAGGDLRVHLEIGRNDELGDAGATLDQMTAWLRERQRMSRFVAPQVLEAVAAGASEHTGQGQLRRAVMLVSDIRSFTGISESQPPRAVFALLNRHLEQMTQVIKRCGGTIDRFIGDAVQAVFFETGVEPPEIRALAAAREMMQAHRALNQEREKAGTFPYEIGIGLASGEMVAGIVGDPAHRLDFTVLGEALREAGELEASSKAGRGSLIMCSEAVCRTLPRHTFHEIAGHPGVWEFEEPLAAGRLNAEGTTKTEFVEVTGTDGRSPDASPGDQVAGRQTWREPLPGWFFHLVFWLLPVIMVIGAVRWLELSRRENAARHTLEQTQEAAALIGQTVDPAFQVSQYLNSEMKEGVKTAFEVDREPKFGFRSVSDRALAKGLIPRLQRLERFFGRMRWSLFGHDSRRDRNLSATTRISTRLLARGGEPWVPMMDRRDAERAFTLYKTYCTGGTPNPTLAEFEKKKLGAWIGGDANQMPMTMQRSCEMLVRQASANDTRFSYWSPFMASDVVQLRLPDDLRYSDKGPNLEIWDNLQGGVLLDIGQECLTSDHVMRSMIRRFRREGFVLAFLANAANTRFPGGVRVWRDPEFSRDAELNSFVRKSERTLIGAGWIGVRGNFPGKFGGDFILARRLPSEVVQTKVTAGWNLVIGAWMFGGLLFILSPFAGSMKRIPLSARLIGAFTVVLLPVLVIGGLTLERSGLERRTRIERDLRRHLDTFLQGIDEEHQLYTGQQCAILSHLARDSRFRNAVIEDEQFKRWPMVKREPGKYMTILPTEASRLFKAFPPLTAVYWWLIGCGVNPNSVVMTNVDEYSRYYPIALSKEVENITMFLFRDLFAQGLARMGGFTGDGNDKEQQRRQLMAGAKFEELRDIFALLFQPADFCEITGSPEAYLEMLVGEVKHNLYRVFLPKNGKATFAFQTVWSPKSLIWQHLNDRPQMENRWSGTSPVGEADFRRMDEVGFTALVPLDEAVYHYPDPFGYPIFQHPTGDCSLKRQNVLLPADIRRLTRTAGQALTAVGMRQYPSGSGEEGDLIRVIPGRRIDRMFLVGVSPVGQILSEAGVQMNRERLVLLGLLLLTVVLARSASHRLLHPIQALTTGARKIMDGDFSIRLNIERSDELGRLSTAFNSMAKGVEEGERLSRFVSDSVREAARNEEHEQAALEGVSCEAVVVFAGLPKFKDQLVQKDPVRLIGDLNRHLQMLAGQVRAHRGEIDKFVGDRILAVFHVSRFPSREDAVYSALAAAEGMRLAAAGPDSPFHQPLGVGLVFGTVLAGIMGTETVRLEYTVIGDTVNLASRLCDVAGSLPDGGVVLDSQMAHMAKKHGRIGQIEVRRVKGKSREVEVFHFESHEGSMPKPRAGFTLLELVMVLALLTVLASLSLPMIEVVDRRAREGALRETLRETRQALAAYRESRASAALMLPLTLPELSGRIPENMLASWANPGPFLAVSPNNPFRGSLDGGFYWELRDGSGNWYKVMDAATVVASGIYDIRFALPPEFPWGARALDGSYYTDW